jgi:hypothetical protein
MPGKIEWETKEIQETLHELHHELEERHEVEKRESWTRYVGLSTAILAVFGAVGALKSSTLINQALIHQQKASDAWTQYQAARGKDHMYSLALNELLDAHTGNVAMAEAMSAPPPEAKKAEQVLKPGSPKPPPTFKSKDPISRANDYRAKVYDEITKEETRSAEAKRLEGLSEEEIHRHHKFEYSVAMIQVAIALGAVSALAKMKPVWYISIAAGLGGIYYFTIGFLS